MYGKSVPPTRTAFIFLFTLLLRDKGSPGRLMGASAREEVSRDFPTDRPTEEHFHWIIQDFVSPCGFSVKCSLTITQSVTRSVSHRNSCARTLSRIFIPNFKPTCDSGGKPQLLLHTQRMLLRCLSSSEQLQKSTTFEIKIHEKGTTKTVLNPPHAI